MINFIRRLLGIKDKPNPPVKFIITFETPLVPDDQEVDTMLAAIFQELMQIDPSIPRDHIRIDIAMWINERIADTERLKGRNVRHILEGDYQIFGCPVRLTFPHNDLIDGKWRIAVNEGEIQ